MTTDNDSELQFLLDQIRDEMRATSHLTGCPTLEQRVMRALQQVPRHAFVPDEFKHSAYANRPLPIGHGQTVSQPYIVALMTELVRPCASDVVLEIGTGSGYQAAILANLVKQVYSIEIVEELAEQARERLQRLGYGNVEVRAGNGRFGWPEHAPYDAIVVTAASPWIPPALIEQLKPGGSLVMPVGDHYNGQDLRVLTKDQHDQVEERGVLPVIFVPLTGSPDEDSAE